MSAPEQHPRRTLIIAEAGVNHDGDLDQAFRLISAAAAAGADLVKFQSFQTGLNISRSAPKAQYQIEAMGSDLSQYDMVKALELTPEHHVALKAECAVQGIKFFSTAFDVPSLEMLLDLGIDRIKVPSGEVTNLPFLRFIARQGLPVIVSTGMANLGEIEAAMAILEEGGVARNDITVLHCNTEYPTPMRDVNLRAMVNIGTALNVGVGYSDHTHGIELPVAAVALGASVIEKHFTMDHDLVGPDHRASLEPEELKAMVSAIRNIELALAGDGVKRPSPSEIGNRAIARKSLVALTPIRAGELYTAHNLGTKRPGTGISPMRWDEVLGQAAPRDFAADELVEL